MGYLVADEVFKAGAHNLGLTPSEHHVLLCLAHFANDTTGRRAYPTYATLAAMSGYSASTIRRACQALADKGIIRLEGTQRKFQSVIATAESWPRASHGEHLSCSPRLASCSPRLAEVFTMTTEPRSNQEHNQEGNLAHLPVRVCSPEGPSSMTCKDTGAKWTWPTLAQHLQIKIMSEIRDNGFDRATAPVDPRGLAKRLRLVAEAAELDREDMHGLMHLYATTSRLWPTKQHPVWGFTAAQVVDKLRNIRSPLVVDIYDPADKAFFAGSPLTEAYLARLKKEDE